MGINSNSAVRIGSLAGVLALTAAGLASADWTNFRGPKHDGISASTGFRKAWTEPIPMRWERELGSAFSSFAVSGGKLYTCGEDNDMQVLYCLDATDGKIIWQLPIEKELKDSFGDGTRATPTVDGDRVYLLGGFGRLVCADAATGELRWSKQFNHKPQWGYAASVLVDGDLAVTTAGKDEGALVAFDKKTGAQVWSVGDDVAGYSTPYPFTFEGKRYIVGFTGESVIIVSAADGKLQWSMPWKTDWKVNAAAPIFHDGHLFITSGYSTGCGLYRLSTSADGLRAEEVWRSKVLLNKFQSCLLHEGHLYTSDQRGLHCVEFLTGVQKWEQRRLEGTSAKHGTLVLADGHLVYLTEKGQLQIAPVNSTGFKAITRADLLSGKCWTVPVLDDNKLYVRNMTRVACFDLSGN
jgi:outer membrane protein assembly factor BamB